ncbi:HAMP domain-containing protein, partial [Lysobacter humi (ex Lee et al. 2017)]
MRSNNSSLADRMLAPATRLMSRFRFTQKAIVIGSTFVVTCGVLAGLIAVNSHTEMSEAQLAASAAAPLETMHDGMLAMQQHRGLRVRANYKVALKPGAIEDSEARAEAAFKAVESWQAEALDSKDLDKPIAAARAAWAKAKSATDVDVVVDSHNEALRQSRLLVKAIEQVTGLGLTNDPAMFYTGRALTEWLPLLSEYGSRHSVTGTKIIGEGSVWAEDRAAIASAETMESFLLDRIQLEMTQLAKTSPDIAKQVQGPMAKAIKAINDQKAVVQTNILDAEVIEMQIPAMAARAEATRAAIGEAIEQMDEAFVAAAEAEVSALRTRAITVLLIVAFALSLSAYLFLGFSRSTRTALNEIKNAAELLAAGQFPDTVKVNSRDELRVIGDGIEKAVTTLRGVARAQQDMYTEHQAGNIDYRIDADQFSGSYGVMADDLNKLVASHIAVKMKVIEIVSQYARGDLSQDIERYPGQKARITEAMDAVKAGMLQVTNEIRTLVDAAKAGDFSQRGNAEAYEFIYREMVANLNTLMESADQGLSDVGSLLAAVSDGDLTQTADEALPGQFGELARNANRTVHQLSGIVGQIRMGSQLINTAAGEIA